MVHFSLVLLKPCNFLYKYIRHKCLTETVWSISHFPVENRKASIDCLEGQSKVAENFKG